MNMYPTFLLVIVVGLCGCSREDDIVQVGNNNAVWTEAIYFKGYRPSTGEKLNDSIIYEYVKTLKENRIKYAYIFAGPYEVDGHLPQYSFSDTAINSVRLMKKLYPELKILPWIGGIQNKTVYLGDTSWVSNAIDDTKKLVEVLKCDGVHIDLEFILKSDEYLAQTINPEEPGDEQAYGDNVNRFHRLMRAKMPTTFISSVVTATSRDTKPWKRKTSMDELTELVKNVDQISFLFYDTGIDNQKTFEKGCEDLLSDIKALRTKSSSTQYLVSIGTFVNDPLLQHYRDEEIEEISNSLKVIKKTSQKLSPGRQIVDGISIFCDWETDRDEWSTFRNNW